jgi:hypothetical protein
LRSKRNETAQERMGKRDGKEKTVERKREVEKKVKE